MSDWWRRKLHGEEPPPQPQYQQPQAYAHPPAGYQPPPGYQLVPIAPGQVDPRWGQGQQPQQPGEFDTSQLPPGSVTVDNFMQMAPLWRGGKGNREAAPCPECGGVMFHRKVGRLEARPLCTSCGWNGEWSQGDTATWSA